VSFSESQVKWLCPLILLLIGQIIPHVSYDPFLPSVSISLTLKQYSARLHLLINLSFYLSLCLMDLIEISLKNLIDPISRRLTAHIKVRRTVIQFVLIVVRLLYRWIELNARWPMSTIGCAN